MSDITLCDGGLLSSTSVPNIFIDHYMTSANGEFVKIYLYLLRCMNQSKETLTISALADIFEHTEKDVLRALTYWEKMQLLHLTYDASGTVSHIALCFPENADTNSRSDIPAAATLQETTPEPQNALTAKTADTIPAKEQYTLEQLESFQDNETVQEILFITENYLGRTLNSTDIRTILYWYDGLHFSTDLIEYLIETCISNGHTSLRYMEKIALSWAEAGITSVTEARQERELHHQDVYAVMKAFGINGRSLISSEIQTIQKWTGQYAMSLDIIQEACRRTIQATGKSSFEYADTILTNWYKNQVHSKNDIIKLDAAHQKSRSAAKNPDTTQHSASNNRFNNFPQRSYNYDQLEKQLLKTSHSS